MPAYVADCANMQHVPGKFPDSFANSGLDNACITAGVFDGVSYESARNFIELFYPRLVRGGILLFDNRGGQHSPGIERAVCEFFLNTTASVMKLPHHQYAVQKV